MKEKWQTRRNSAEVMIEGTMPPQIVCDCGPHSTPKNVERALWISILPEMTRFLKLCFKQAEVIERVGLKEVHLKLEHKDYQRIRSYMAGANLLES